MLKNLQKPLLKLNWRRLPSFLEKEKEGTCVTYCSANLIPLLKPHSRCKPIWVKDSCLHRILVFRSESVLSTLTHSAQQTCFRGRIHPSHIRHFYIFFVSFHGLLLTLSFTPVWDDGEYYILHAMLQNAYPNSSSPLMVKWNNLHWNLSKTKKNCKEENINLYNYWKISPISGPMQFKPILFKGQLYDVFFFSFFPLLTLWITLIFKSASLDKSGLVCGIIFLYNAWFDLLILCYLF